MMREKKNKLKVAVIIRNYVTTGGAERYAYELTKRLTDSCEVHVFCQRFDKYLGKGIVFHKIPTICNRPTFVNQMLFSWYTKRAVDDSFDVIHSHERISYFDVLTVHCPCFKGFITSAKKSWRKVWVWLGVVTSLRCLGHLWLEKQQFKITDHKKVFLAVSENVKADVQRNYKIPDSFFVKAYSGVDTVDLEDPLLHEKSLIYRAELGVTKRDTVLLFVGTEFKRKGLDNLLQAFALVKNKDLKLVVVGGGDIALYKIRATKLGIADRVLFAGLVKNVFAYYLMADIFIMPTLTDPGPMSVLEAMFCGVPVIMSDEKYCGSAEHIQSGEALLIENPSRPELLCQAIVTMLDPEFRKNIALKGQKIAQQLTWEKTTEKTLDAYWQILKES